MDLEPLIETCRPKGKTPPQDLRRTISAILWRHQNGAKWRAIPAELGPWSRAAQMFIRWAHLVPWRSGYDGLLGGSAAAAGATVRMFFG
jgi:transposase